MNTEQMVISNMRVRAITKHVAKDFIEKHHYTHKMGSTRYALGLFCTKVDTNPFFVGDGEALIGCMTYGHPVSNRAVDSICKTIPIALDSVLELTRLVVLDGTQKNTESWFIGQSFDWLRKNDPGVKILISYADPEQYHTGTIYRATNWLYQGCGVSKIMPDFSIKLFEDSEWIHSRTVGSKFGNKNIENLARTIGHTFWRKEETAKHRYLYFLCHKKEKERFLKDLKIPVFDYSQIKPYTQLIQKVYVTDGELDRIEVVQGIDVGWTNRQTVMNYGTEHREG